MKKCNDCNVEMKKGTLFGQLATTDINNKVNKFFIKMETGRKVSTILGKVPETIKLPLAAIFCPSCGKVEFYCDINQLK